MMDPKELAKWENICARRAEERKALRPGYTATVAVIESEAEYIVPKLVVEVQALRALLVEVHKVCQACPLCGGVKACALECRLGAAVRTRGLLS